MLPELVCLATLVYHEARDQELSGQAAVAHVALNRVEDRRWPDEICEVVYDGGEIRYQCQFSFWCDGLPDGIYNSRAWRKARLVATLVSNGSIEDPTGGATHYHASYVLPYWAGEMHVSCVIGDHIFYL